MKGTGWIILIIIIIGIGGFFVIGKDESKIDDVISDGPKTTITNVGDTPKSPDASASEYSIEVIDQSANSVVNVSSVALTDGGWLVVYEGGENNIVRILGAKRLDAGSYQNVEVELLSTGFTKSGEIYFVTLFDDDGDKEFDHKVDQPIRDGAANLTIVAEFMAN